MKTTLVCTECSHRFTMPGDFSWDNVTCPACEISGGVVGRIMDGLVEYFEPDPEEEADPEAETVRFQKVMLEDMKRIAESGEDLSEEPDDWGYDEQGKVVDLR
jgi:hypothetical protein